MSRICGIIRFDGQEVKKEDIQSMLVAMNNDDNDCEGIWIDDNVGFGHTMLWTTPESLHENQPFVNIEKNLLITADARIDNRDELFEKLQINNKFKIVTDVELILLTYQRWGEECSKYLKGDFAFSIWDKCQKKLFCTRDRFGIKPFYFHFSNMTLYFSSDIDSLYSCIDEPITVNNHAIKSFGKYGSIGYEETMYENIYRIPPAYMFVFFKEGLSKNRYWFPEKIKINYNISFREAQQNVYNLLSNAVKSRLRIYGDWGCELSGGLDSTVISLIVQKTTNTQFKTFSMRYRSYSCDEWKYTKEAISTLKSVPIILDVDQLDIKNRYNLNNSVQLNKHWPQYGSFIYNYALGEKMVENNVRVCLTGHGGDHIFTGNWNPTFEYLKNLRFFEALDAFHESDKTIYEFIFSIAKTLVPRKIKLFFKKYFLKTALYSAENFIDYWKISSIKSDVKESNLNNIVGRHHVMHTDNNHYRVLEASKNIEFRHPFFDTDLIEYVLTLPNYYKYKSGTIKIVLREAFKDLYPSIIYKRDDKAEFSEALLAQLNEIDLFYVWKDSLLIKNELIDQTYIRQLLDKYQLNSIEAIDVGNLWRRTTLELWLENKIKLK